MFLAKKMDFSFYSHPDSASFFVSIIAIHSPAAVYAINFCRECMGNFHMCRVTKQAAESRPLKGINSKDIKFFFCFLISLAKINLKTVRTKG